MQPANPSLRRTDAIRRHPRAGLRTQSHAELSWLPWLALATALTVLSGMGVAWGQSTSQPPVTQAPPRAAPNGPGPQAPPEQMAPASPPRANKGVIHPPAHVDPGMTRRPPAAQKFPTPVIPPPAPPAGQTPR